MIEKVVDGAMLAGASVMWVVVVANTIPWYIAYSPWLLYTQVRRAK